MPSDEPADKRLELAYAAAETKLSMQDATLGNVRTRANNLLATAALFTSFSAGIGLVNVDPSKGGLFSPIAAGVLFVVVVALGASVIVVIWPAKGWVFVPSAEKIMMRYDAGDDEVSIRKYVIGEMIKGGNKNAAQLKFKQNAFRAAAVHSASMRMIPRASTSFARLADAQRVIWVGRFAPLRPTASARTGWSE